MSDMNLYRLSDNTAAEPLVNKWVAWAHVLAPVASSLHLQKYQIKILQSYLEDPKVHYQTCSNPKMRSGRFVEIQESRITEVRDLLTETEVKQYHNLKFADQIIKFHNYLVEHADGHTLDPYYERLPRELRGYVELVYDYYNRPTMRFFESLLYESIYYKKDLQSIRLFSQERDNSRSFIMNTPRLLEDHQIDLRIPFESPVLDELFALENSPRPFGYIKEILGLQPSVDRRLLRLLTNQPVARREKWNASDARIQYYGHACVLIEWNGVSILTDPCLSVMPSLGGEARLTYRDLPETIDYVLITHNHHDHFCVESLLRLRHKVKCLVVPRTFGIAYGDLSLKLLARKIGFKNVVEMETLESFTLPDGEIICIPFVGEHADLPHGKTAYAVRTGSRLTLFGADSDCLDARMYQHIRAAVGPIDTVFLGMECVGAPLSWSCGAFLPDKPTNSIDNSRRYKGCDSVRAMKLLETVGAKRIYIYAMGLEPWLEHLLGLAYTDDATQIKEARNLVAQAIDKGFEDARILSGAFELCLDSSSGKQTSNGVGGFSRETLKSNLIEPQLNYWVDHLKRACAVATSSNNTQRTAVSDSVATYRFTLGRQLNDSIRVFSRARGDSLFMVTLAALKVLLHRYSGEDQITVGTPLSRRDLRETQEISGCILNTVALSTDLSDNPTFGQLLERVREEVIGGQANQDVPFEMVVERLGLNTGVEEPRLFDVWFSLEQGEGEVEISRGQFELTMMLKERAEELEGRVIYSSESYDEATIAEMVEGYARVLEQMIEREETRVLDVELARDSQGMEETVDEDPLLAEFTFD